jgi:hypothetical protein
VTGSLEGDRVAFCGSSMMAAMGGGRKGCSMGGGGVAPFEGGTRRLPRTAETVGGTAGGSRRRSCGRLWRRPRSERGRHGGTIVWTMGLTSGAHAIS